jgi:hypothetical protein
MSERPIRSTLLACGIAAPALYVAMILFTGLLWDEYSSASQTVSELSAIGAPTRTLWIVLSVVYIALVVAFGFGVRLSGADNRALRVLGAVLIASGVVGIFWPPMHQRAVLAAGGATLTDTLHLVWTGITGVVFTGAIVAGAAAFGARFRLYSVATVVIMVASGALTGRDAPLMQANLPTPWIGVWERLNIVAFMLWMAVVAIKLLCRGRFGRTDHTAGASSSGFPNSGFPARAMRKP